MGTFSISGLTSGIDTASLITQLMTVAAKPQTQLKSTLSTVESTSAAYQNISGALSAAAAALTALGAASRSVTSVGSTPVWSAMTVTSSSAAVAASTGPGAVAGASLTFDVVALARAQVSTVAVSNGVAVSDTDAGIDITGTDGSVVHVDLVDGSAGAVAAAVNAADAGVRAQVVATDAGDVLRFTGTSTGTAAGFTVTGLDRTPTTVTAASDARIQVGAPGSGGYTVSSATNTFTGVESGVTFSVAGLATGVELDVAADEDSVTAGVKAAVDAINSVLTTVGTATARGGVLAGDGTVRPLAQALLSAVTDGSAGASFATYGISLTSDGRLSFDEDTFRASFAATPSQVVGDVGSVLAQRLADVVDGYAATGNGRLTAATDSAAQRQTSLQKQIDAWDVRLADQRARLETKFAAMETALQRLQSQGSYLTSVFASLENSQSSQSS